MPSRIAALDDANFAAFDSSVVSRPPVAPLVTRGWFLPAACHDGSVQLVLAGAGAAGSKPLVGGGKAAPRATPGATREEVALEAGPACKTCEELEDA
mmetsp:Transcript_95949/g.271290  ORF Transcript_95949/g.271290 Transcript_95949/m.271290 type:complete len:97 (+) Transcript_95949:541-831(+)